MFKGIWGAEYEIFLPWFHSKRKPLGKYSQAFPLHSSRWWELAIHTPTQVIWRRLTVPRNADMFRTSHRKEPTQIPKGSCCWSVWSWAAALDVIALALSPLQKLGIHIHLSCPQASPRLSCLSICLTLSSSPRSRALAVLERGVCQAVLEQLLPVFLL